MIKPENVELVKTVFEKIDKNLKFTYDTFHDEHPHFLDIDIHPDGLKIYRKSTFTGHYTDFSSYVPWAFKISWIQSLVYRAKHICDPKFIKDELTNIKLFASWNGFPSKVRDKLVNKFYKSSNNPANINTLDENDDTTVTVWLNIPFIGPKGDQLVKSFKKQIVET